LVTILAGILITLLHHGFCCSPARLSSLHTRPIGSDIVWESQVLPACPLARACQQPLCDTSRLDISPIHPPTRKGNPWRVAAEHALYQSLAMYLNDASEELGLVLAGAINVVLALVASVLWVLGEVAPDVVDETVA
jgi:hypothetical protein